MDLKKIGQLSFFFKQACLVSLLFIHTYSYAALPTQCPDLSNGFTISSTSNTDGTYNTSILGSIPSSTDVWYGVLNHTKNSVTLASLVFSLVEISSNGTSYFPNCNYLSLQDGFALSLKISSSSSNPPSMLSFSQITSNTGTWQSTNPPFSYPICKVSNNPPPAECTFNITP